MINKPYIHPSIKKVLEENNFPEDFAPDWPPQEPYRPEPPRKEFLIEVPMTEDEKIAFASIKALSEQGEGSFCSSVGSMIEELSKLNPEYVIESNYRGYDAPDIKLLYWVENENYNEEYKVYQERMETYNVDFDSYMEKKKEYSLLMIKYKEIQKQMIEREFEEKKAKAIKELGL